MCCKGSGKWHFQKYRQSMWGIFRVQLGITFETHKSNNDICIKMKGGKIKSYSNIHTLLKVTDYSWYFSSDTGVHEIVFVISW